MKKDMKKDMKKTREFKTIDEKSNLKKRFFSQKNNYLIILALVVFILFLSAVFISIADSSETKKNIAAWEKLSKEIDYSDLEDETPTFTNIVTTAYFTASFSDYNGDWCSPKKSDCFKSSQEIADFYKDSSSTKSCIIERGGSFCCIPEADRGFYEDVKCQGSGVYNGKVYYYKYITPDKDTTTGSLSSEFKNGITAKLTNPVPHRTVAVNSRAGTNCYIPYWQKMYIYFGKDNPWNGVYIAEDTGAAFDGRCKIDIYAGVGETEKGKAITYVSGKTPKIYLLDDNGNVIPANAVYSGPSSSQQVQSSVVGTLYTPYSHSETVNEIDSLFKKTYGFVSAMMTECMSSLYKTVESRKDCIKNRAEQSSGAGIKIRLDCREEELPFYDLDEIKKDWDFVDSGGYVFKKEKIGLVSIGKNNLPVETLAVNVTDGSTKNLTFLLIEEAASLDMDIDVGDYVMVRDSVSYSDWERIAPYKENILINPDASKMEAVKEIAVKLAECSSSSENECLCFVDFKARLEYLNFIRQRISYSRNFEEGTYVELSEHINVQDTTVQGRIEKVPVSEISYLLDPAVPFFVKKDSKGELIIVKSFNEQGLPQCTPSEDYFLVCSELSGKRKEIFENPTTTSPSSIVPYQQINSECSFYFDSANINSGAVKSSRMSFSDLDGKLDDYNLQDTIRNAHTSFRRVPVPLIKAIINVEVGSSNIIDDYLSGKKACNEFNMCSPMQVSRAACASVNYGQDLPLCSFSALESGDVKNGILSGTAYLDYIIRTSKYIDREEPDYYFVALGFNAGPGSLNKIMEASAARLGKKERELKWRDISYDDVKTGLINTGESWAKSPDKWDEVWEYPNLMGNSIVEQCGDTTKFYVSKPVFEPDVLRFALKISK